MFSHILARPFGDRWCIVMICTGTGSFKEKLFFCAGDHRLPSGCANGIEVCGGTFLNGDLEPASVFILLSASAVCALLDI